MISNEAAKCLGDAQRAAERIARFAADRSFDDHLADEMLRAAIERQFEIIGDCPRAPPCGGARHFARSMAMLSPRRSSSQPSAATAD